ncbi:hypothetical protein BJ741DRAFT_597642 [Chytriomyces cf. hyalinus JEL632]|nr:hypothetical protein BJ741DRAFT_597642 [Chytriomyces cf. hyalinus JEL632]
MARPVPQFVYKIAESAPPTPLPASLPLSSLDAQDGFIHMSNLEQMPITAAKWFTQFNRLIVLKVDSAKAQNLIGQFKWLDDGATGCIHLYSEKQANPEKLESIGAETVVGVFAWIRPDGKTWDQVPCPN